MTFNPTAQVRLHKAFASHLREAADILAGELDEQRLEIALLPAPDQCHTGHSIRVAVNSNPHWFRTINSTRRLRRDRAERALQQIAETGEFKSAAAQRLESIVTEYAERIANGEPLAA